jgi:hypothetical protein
MHTIKYNGHKIEMYDSIQSLPIWRFQEYNKYMVVESGIGSDLEAIDTSLTALRSLISQDPNAAIRKTVNYQQSLHFIMQNVSPKMAAFFMLVNKIDGEKVTDDELTDEGITELIRKLSRNGFGIGLLDSFLELFKKKIEREFEQFFPGMIDNGKVKEFYAKLRQRTLLVLQSVRHDREEIKEQIERIDKSLTTNVKPRIFHGAQGVEVQMTKEFESTLVLLRQHNAAGEPRKLTTLSYYQALEVIKEQNKEKRA